MVSGLAFPYMPVGGVLSRKEDERNENGDEKNIVSDISDFSSAS